MSTLELLTQEEIRTAVREGVRDAVGPITKALTRDRFDKPYLTKRELQELTG